MRKISIGLVVFFISFSTIFAQVEQEVVEEDAVIHLDWKATIEEAIQKSKAEKKPILIYFTGSDWCGPCMQLDRELFHTEKFERFANEKLVLYEANFPRNRDLVTPEKSRMNKQLAKRYKQTSFPTMLLIDGDGNVLGRKNGKYMADYYYPFFEGIVNQFSGN